MLQGKEYIPLLKTGIAELGAYRNLFPDVLDLIFPIFNVRPWPNAKHFNYTIEKLKEATGARPYGFSLDPARHGHASARPAQREFDALFTPQGGFGAYYELLASLREAVPTLVETSSPDILRQQLANAEGLDRGLIVHERKGADGAFWNMAPSLGNMPHDTIVVVDAGWSKDYLSQEVWLIPKVEQILSILPSAELVIMSSSFPDSFAHIVGTAEEEGTEHRLFSAARQRFQQADLTFGDWASTRPTQGGGGNYIPSRVDVPKYSSWQIFRADPDDDRGFCEMAWDAQHHECYPETPDCWGKQTIQATDDQGSGITSRQAATQVRINIHMTIQSGAASVPPTDEIPYED